MSGIRVKLRHQRGATTHLIADSKHPFLRGYQSSNNPQQSKTLEKRGGQIASCSGSQLPETRMLINLLMNEIKNTFKLVIKAKHRYLHLIWMEPDGFMEYGC